MVKKLLEVFMKNNCKKLVKKQSEQKKYSKKKGDKLISFNYSFNSRIDKKGLI